jgi:CRP/FNR family transcriptional regulator, cyclic AMP receptor protein
MSRSSGFFDYGVGREEADVAVQESFLAGASDADWTMLLAYGERRSVAPDEAVIEFGEASRSLLIVLRGSFRVLAPARRHGRWRVVDHIDAGSVIGELAFFDGAPRSRSVVAEDSGEVFVLEWEAFQRLAAVRPALAISILSDLGVILTSRFRRRASEALANG